MFTPGAQNVIDRLEKASKKYGQVFDKDGVIEAMQKHYKLLGVAMPKVVVIDNMEEAYKWVAKKSEGAARGAAWDAAWDAARGAAWGAARGAAWGAARDAAALNSMPNDPQCLKFAEIELCLLEALEKGLGFFFPMRDNLVIVPVPKIRVNTMTRLHSDQFKAVEWKDGSGYHFLNGVRFPEDLWQEVVSGDMNFAKILAIKDIDQRTQAMKYGKVEDFIKFNEGVLLDEYQKWTVDMKEINYKLYKLPRGKTFQTVDAFFMVYDCPSTDRLYMSGVEPFEKVEDAMAWKFNTTPKEWKEMVPLINES